MPDQSQREEMSAAIRAQRERSAVPRTIAPEPPLEPAPPPGPDAAGRHEHELEEAAPEPPPRRLSLFGRLRGK
jgi:hypothetical protein